MTKPAAKFDPNSPLRFVGDLQSTNGLSRAFRYEMDRWAAIYGANPPQRTAEQALILAQPWDYPRLLAEPPEWFQRAYRIGLWVWELEQFPSDWRFALDIVHEIWTPSEFSANALRSGTDLPIKVVPHAVVVPKDTPLPRSRFGVRDEQFLGLAIMDLAACPDRKNPLGHVRAWVQAFADDPDVHLLMKVRFKKATQFALTALKREIAGAKNITLVQENFDDQEISRFQRMADVYLSLHRAEGYGLNIHEMLEIGVPTIATGWSGNMEYMGRYAHAFPIPYQLTPYKDRTFAYEGENLCWAEPDIKAAAAVLRKIRADWQVEQRTSERRVGDPS